MIRSSNTSIDESSVQGSSYCAWQKYSSNFNHWIAVCNSELDTIEEKNSTNKNYIWNNIEYINHLSEKVSITKAPHSLNSSGSLDETVKSTWAWIWNKIASVKDILGCKDVNSARQLSSTMNGTETSGAVSSKQKEKENVLESQD